MTGDGSIRIGGPRVARRRHDRLIQEERRRQEQEQEMNSPLNGVHHHHQQQQDQQDQQQKHGEESIEVGYKSDAYTMTSSKIISGGGDDGGGAASATILRSPASSTQSTNSSSRRLSAARQNMMQRRIEARKRQEERQRQQDQQQKQQQQMQEQPLQNDAHPSSNIIRYPAPVFDNKQKYDQSQVAYPDHGKLSTYSSFQGGQQQQQHRPPPQPQHHSYSHLQNDPKKQQPNQHPHMGQWQHRQFKSQSNHPNHNAIPSPPMVERTQESANGCSPSYDSCNMPINNSSNHLFHYQVYHPRELEQSGIIRNVGPTAGPSSSTLHPHHPPPHRSSQRQYQQTMSPPSASAVADNSVTNRLRNYESPSDEWHGHHIDESGDANYSGMNSKNVLNMSLRDVKKGPGGHQQRQMMYHEPSLLVETNQYYMKQQLQHPDSDQPQSHSHARQRESLSQPQIRHNEHTAGDLMTNVGNRGALKNNSSSTSLSMQGLPRGSTMGELPKQQKHPPLQPQSQSRNLQTQLPHSHHTPMYQPDWNNVNQLSRDDNRQRLYQRHLASKQKYQKQQRQEESQNDEESNEILLQQQQHSIQQQDARSQQKQQAEEGNVRQTSRASSPRLSDLSPVEHLGNRTDYIQRKNKFVFPKTLPASTSSSSLGNNKRHGVISISDSCGASVVSEQARKFEEAALKQQQQLSRQRRIEQRRKIEDRWINRHKDTVSVGRVATKENRGNRPQQYPNESYGYYSNGGSQEEQRQQQQGKRYTEGYQSDDQSKGCGQYQDLGYRSEGGEAGRNYHQDEFQSRVDCSGGNYVDSDAITPRDARHRLWDENERLRVVLPQHERHRSNSYSPRDGLPEHPHRVEFASPGNRSGSSSAGGGGGRFKSKFVHAAALAAQNRTNSACDEWQHSQKSHPMHRECMETGEELHRQQLGDNISTKKNSTVVSHYTDSTAETTAEITTIPGGSFGSSRNNSSTARKISLSPPRHLSKAYNDGNLALPSIDEQGITPALPLPEEYRNSTISVADLIARINAVSRSNPEQALAAIDSIIKKESGSIDRNKHVMSSGAGIGKSATIVTKEVDLSRTNVITPRSKEEKEKGASEGVRHLGKDFFQNYEQILLSDSKKVIRATADSQGNRGHEDQVYDDGDDDDDDDSLLSSDESTVSSMTDPTYQSVKLKSTALKDAPTSISTKERSNGHRSSQSKFEGEYTYPPRQPQKSLNTLKKEYNVRKLSPSEHEENSTPLGTVDALQSASRDEIKFKYDVDPDGNYRHQERKMSHDMEITNLEKKSASNGAVNAAIKTQLTSNDKRIGKIYAENSHDKSHERGGTLLNQEDKSTVTKKRDLTHQSQRKKPSSGNALPTSSKTPESNKANKPAMRPDTPDLMMTVTNAFANVDISFGGAKSTSHPTVNATAAASQPHDRPMPSLISPESDDGEKTLKSFQTISDAFSDVDISFEQEKTVSQRRKELEYYSKSWTTSKSSSYDSDDKQQQQNAKHPSSTDAAAVWAKSSLSKSRSNTSKEKKTVEPTLRLKGSKSLAQKFANLIKAFDD